MREFKLAANGFVRNLLVAQDFGNAENGGQGIIQLVSDASEHLAHGGELFGLNELLFQALDFGDVAAGDDDAFDFPLLVEKRAEMAADAAPFAVLMPHAHFEGSEGLAAGENFVKERAQGRAVLGMSSVA